MDLRISDLMFARSCHWPCIQAKPEGKSVKEQMSDEGHGEHWLSYSLKKAGG
jgi:hypothetical protein